MPERQEIFPILAADDPRGAERLARLAGRVAELETLVSAQASARTVAAFGEPLSTNEVVKRIVRDVRARGDDAVREYTLKLDGVELSDFRVPEADLDRALGEAPEAFITAAERAAANIHRYQERLLPPDAALEEREGLLLGARWTPVERALCYVPGGIASYPSSVLMNAVPAQVAGVDRVIVTLPPGREGAENSLTLAAAALVGCREVYKLGGVQAIAAFAYGTATIPKVDAIVGPGNLFVMLAKKEVFGAVNIDMFAGPSEILVLADGSVAPELAAADLLSQAEHDPMASAILVATSAEYASRVREALLAQAAANPRREVAEASLRGYGLALIARDMAAACRIASDLAPEHLEILADDPVHWAGKIRNAGAIFLGPWSPESLGDYAAGPSHTLPTGGTARFMSGLSPLSFMKRTSLIGASEAALRAEMPVIEELARADRLPAHADSARRRFGPNAT